MYAKTTKLQKKYVAPKFQDEKRCETKGGSQEMAVIIVQWQKF